MATILLVEDDPNQRILYSEELARGGYEVLTAADGSEALYSLDQRTPDLVVMDISMPGMDGIEAMGRILSQHNRLPVILNTAYASYKDNFLSWSADAYVIKSSDLTELKAAIRKLLEKNKLEVLAAAVETGGEDGMQTFNQSIYNHIKAGLVTEAEGMRYATNPESLRMNLQGIFLDEGSRILGT